MVETGETILVDSNTAGLLKLVCVDLAQTGDARLGFQNGELVKITFTIKVGSSGGVSPLTFQSLSAVDIFSVGIPNVTRTDGSVTVNMPVPFEFSVSNGGNQTVLQGGSASTPIMATLLGGTSQSVTFSASGLPGGGSFAPTSCLPTCQTLLTMTAGSGTAPGAYPVVISASGGGLLRTTSFTLTVAAPPAPTDTTPPTVTMTSPATGTIVARSTVVTLAASASDNVGVASVQFLVNGNVVCTDASAPYSCAWTVPGAKAKSYTLQATATDATGNVGRSASVSVTVGSSTGSGAKGIGKH